MKRVIKFEYLKCIYHNSLLTLFTFFLRAMGRLLKFLLSQRHAKAWVLFAFVAKPFFQRFLCFAFTIFLRTTATFSLCRIIMRNVLFGVESCLVSSFMSPRHANNLYTALRILFFSLSVCVKKKDKNFCLIFLCCLKTL